MAFAREVVEAAGTKWETIQIINAQVVRLESKRVGRVPFDPLLRNHTLVWQIRVFEQVALHRIVSLAQGCMTMWNARDIYGAALFARSIMEITSLVHDLCNELNRFIESNDLSAARDLLVSRTLGTSGDPWSANARGTVPASVLATIAKLDQQNPGSLDAYTQLSEMFQPASVGIFAMFVIIDEYSKDVTFDYFKYHGPMLLDKIAIAFLMLGVFEVALEDIQNAAQCLSTAIH